MLRACTLLGPNTVDPLDAVVRHLAGRGHRLEIVDSRAGVDLLWACGLLTAELIADGAELEVVAAPVFPGETEPVYRSVVVARRAGQGTRRLAVNEYGSWSGYQGLLRSHRLAPWLSGEIVISGSHLDSIAAVAAGNADAAAIDHSVWDWVVAHQPALVADLMVLETSDDWPAPPFSVRRSASARDLVDDLLSYPPAPNLEIVPATFDRYQFMKTAS